MRRSWSSRLYAAVLAMWFVVSIVAEPVSMGGSMAGMSMPAMNMTAGNMSMNDMPMTGMDMSRSATNPDEAPVQDNESANCSQHDCCCSAFSPSLLTPQAALSWIPEHVIDQAAPPRGEIVTYTEGQLLLPFANGPPNTVSA
jgi:hypothetical protein